MSTPAYRERLRVPLRWWVQATMFLATLWIALIVATPALIAWGATAALVASTAGLLVLIGSPVVEVRDGVLYAANAHIPLAHTGVADALDADQTRRVAGVDANARAFLLLRPYIKTSVRVSVEDPGDPTPYWLISTRHPAQLAAALQARARIS